jgi:hypothetical protein
MSHSALILITVVSLGGWLAWSAFAVTRFNLRLRELWRLLQSKGRGRRVKEVRDDPWTNLPQQRYLFDEVDFDDPEIRALKLELRALWRKGIGSLVLVIPLSFLLTIFASF